MSGSNEWEMLLEWLNDSTSSPLSPAPGKTLLVDGLPTALHLLRSLQHTNTNPSTSMYTHISAKHGKSYPKLWGSAVVDLFKKGQGSHRVVALMLVQKTLEVCTEEETSGLQQFLEVIGLALRKESPSDLRLQAVSALKAWMRVDARVKLLRSQAKSRSSDTLSRCFTALGHILMEESWYRNDLLRLLRVTAQLVRISPSSCRGVAAKMETLAARHVLSGDKGLRSAAAQLLGRLPLCFGGQGGRVWENLLVTLMNGSRALLHSGVDLGYEKSTALKGLEELAVDGEAAAWGNLASTVRRAVEEMRGEARLSHWRLLCPMAGIAQALTTTLRSGAAEHGGKDPVQRRTFVRMPLTQIVDLCEANLQELLAARCPGVAGVDAAKTLLQLLSAVVDVAGMRSLMHARKIQGLFEAVSRAIALAENGWKAVEGEFLRCCASVLLVLGPGFVNQVNVPIDVSVRIVETAVTGTVSRSRKRKRVGLAKKENPTVDLESVSAGLALLTTALSVGGGLLNVPVRLRIEQALLRLLANNELFLGMNEAKRQVRVRALKALTVAMAVPIKGSMVSSRLCDALITFQRGRASKEEAMISAQGEAICAAFLHPPRKSLLPTKLIEQTAQEVLDAEPTVPSAVEESDTQEMEVTKNVEQHPSVVEKSNDKTPPSTTTSAEEKRNKTNLPAVTASVESSTKPVSTTMDKVKDTSANPKRDEDIRKTTVAVDVEEGQGTVEKKLEAEAEAPLAVTRISDATEDADEDEESDSDESIPSIVT